VGTQVEEAKTTLRTAPELHRQFKAAAALSGMTLERWAELACVEKLARPVTQTRPDPAILGGLSTTDRNRVVRYVRLITADKKLAALEDQRITLLLRLAESGYDRAIEYLERVLPRNASAPDDHPEQTETPTNDLVRKR